MFDNLSDREVQQLREDPRVFASSLLSHPDNPERPYDFRTTKGDEKLNYLLHDNGPLNPENWGNINLLKFARGCLKTTTMTMLATWSMFMHPTTNIYMTAPRQGQVREFSERLNDKARDSGLMARNKVDNIERKIFEISTASDHGENVYKAKFQADSGWTEESLRGPHSHLGIIDEFQDISRDSFETFMPAIDRELPSAEWAPCVWVLGTPKLEGSFYHQLWQDSDRREWDRQSLEWDPKSERREWTPSDELMEEMGFEDVDVDGYEVAGWHVDQYNSPLHTPQQIARDKANFEPRKFKNEVEARFYSPEDDLLSLDDVRNGFFDDERSFTNRRQSEDSHVTMGVDWGGGRDEKAAVTAIMVVEWRSFGEGHEGIVRRAKALDESLTPSEELVEVESILNDYSVDDCVVDHGYGHASMVDLQDGNDPVDPSGYSNTVVGAKYGNVANASNLKYETDSGKRRFFTCDKTYVIERTVEAVKNGDIVCPSGTLSFDGTNTLGGMIEDHLTNPFKDYTETPSGTRKIRVQTSDGDHDDFLDALVFAHLAHEQLGQTATVPIAATSSRFA